MKKTYWVLLLVIIAIAATSLFIYGKNRPKGKLPAKVDFNNHIRPILSDRCFKCHGPDSKQRQASLRLDIADSAFTALKEHPGSFAIVPGDPLHSQMFLRISSTDTTEQMPPPSSNLSLSESPYQLNYQPLQQQQ